MTVNELLTSPPKLHNWGSGVLVSSGLPTPVFKFMDDVLRPDSLSLETGMGISTAVFALKETKHTCINPDAGEITRFKEFVYANSISIEKMTFISKRSDEVWFELRNSDWDLILIDGCHGFPIPYMDWYFFSQGLKINGYLIVDDTLISTGKELKEFLLHEEAWVLVPPFSDKTAIFQKVKAFDYNKEFIFQPYVLQATEQINQPKPVIRFVRGVKAQIKKLLLSPRILA